MTEIIDSLKLGWDKAKGVANRFDPQAKFKWELMKPGVREFSLNECRIAATPENFEVLERGFNYGRKLLSMSDEDINSLADDIIKGINEEVLRDKPPLIETEREAVKKVIHEYFDSLRQQANYL